MWPTQHNPHHPGISSQAEMDHDTLHGWGWLFMGNNVEFMGRSWVPPGSPQPGETHQTCLASAVPSSAASGQGDGAQHRPTGPQRFPFACGSRVTGAGPSTSCSGCMLLPLARASPHCPGRARHGRVGSTNRGPTACASQGPVPGHHGDRHPKTAAPELLRAGGAAPPWERAGVPHRHPSADSPWMVGWEAVGGKEGPPG